MPKPPSPIVLVISNSPSRVPAARVSAWPGPPVAPEGGAVVGIEVVPEVDIDVGGRALRHRRRNRLRRRGSRSGAAADGAGICPVRGPPGGRMMVRSSSSGFMQRSPPWRRGTACRRLGTTGMVPNSTARQPLHRLEQVHVSAAYRQFLAPAANPHEQAAQLVAPGAREMVEVDDRRAVDLLEARRIELRRQLGDRACGSGARRSRATQVYLSSAWKNSTSATSI